MMPKYHRKKTPASNAFTDLIRAVLRMASTAEKEGSKLTRGLNLSSARWQTLGVLHWSEEKLTVSQIARKMGVTRQAVQQLVNEMQTEGLIFFSENPSDARAMHILLTDEGKERYTQALEREWQWTNKIVKGMDANQIRASVDLISLLTEKMESKDD